MASVLPKVRTGDLLTLQGPVICLKNRPTAEVPFKENIKEVGYQITIVERTENRTEDVYADANTFATGLILNAPKHYHLEIIEHPDLYKAGYMLMGGPRIIDPDNEEELVLPLYKFKEVEDIELPFRAALMVVRETEYANVAGESQSQKRAAPEPQKWPSRGGRSMQTSQVKSSKTQKGSGVNHMF